MKTRKVSSLLLVGFVVLVLAAMTNTGYSQQGSVNLWYGNLDGTALDVDIDENVNVDLYVSMDDTVYVADCHFVLATSDQYVDTILSQSEGTMYYPFNLWEIKEFTDSYGSPPNEEGWTSVSFIGWARIAADAPWLHWETPTRVLRHVIHTVDNDINIGDDFGVVSVGLNPQQGPSNAGDTLGGPGYIVVEEFSPLHFVGGGYIEGTVTDSENSNPLEGVSVVNNTTSKETFTDENGYYHMGHFPGTFSFTFSLAEYDDTVVEGVIITLDETIIQDVALDIHVGIEDQVVIPTEYAINQNYPNPFNATTNIYYSIPEDAYVTIDIFDLLGRKVETLVSGNHAPGIYTATWNGSNVTSGMYFYIIQANDFSEKKTMLLLK